MDDIGRYTWGLVVYNELFNHNHLGFYRYVAIVS